MKTVAIILRRELASYFATPLAYVVIVIFLLLANLFAFFFGALFERGQADLTPFFTFLPWLYLFLIPAVSMRLWAEERRNGSIELLLTQPITLWQAVLGKFLAAWAFVGIALALTFPIWITDQLPRQSRQRRHLRRLSRQPLHRRRFPRGRLVHLHASRSNQLIAFLIAVLLCFLLLMAGYPVVTDFFQRWAPQWLVDGVASLSFLAHFENIIKGVLDLRDVLYYALVTIFFLLASTVVLDARKSK